MVQLLQLKISSIHLHVSFFLYIWTETWENTLWHVRLTISLHTVWPESSLSAWRNFAPLVIQNALGEDSDQTVRTHRLIWIFSVRTCPKIRLLFLFRYILISIKKSCKYQIIRISIITSKWKSLYYNRDAVIYYIFINKGVILFY